MSTKQQDNSLQDDLQTSNKEHDDKNNDHNNHNSEINEEPLLNDSDSIAEDSAEQDTNESATITGGIFTKIDELEKQVSLYKDQALRLQAEMANIKRRSELEIEKAHKFGIDKIAKELIPVVDSLEKGIESAKAVEAPQQGFIEGLDLILKQLLSALEKFGIKQVDPLGEPFNPHYHQAVASVAKPESEPNTVIEVCQKGCTLYDRVLRPAMVVVAAK